MGALVLLVIGYFTYVSSTREEVNPFTGEKVRVKLTPDQEVTMGLQSAPQMIKEFGGEYREPILANKINETERIGNNRDKVEPRSKPRSDRDHDQSPPG
jgi:predicted Zn-dependent protease